MKVLSTLQRSCIFIAPLLSGSVNYLIAFKFPRILARSASSSIFSTSIKSLTFLMMGATASSGSSVDTKYPIYADESIMNAKDHGTCVGPVQRKLRWNCAIDTADRICCYNRHYAEYSGYWESTKFLTEVDKNVETTFYDAVTGKPLFIAPRGRTFEEFRKESQKHGWPSFRDNEVVWENVRCLKNGEAVSVDGTHLGHNLPDSKGNRYCINLVSVAGYPADEVK